MFAQPKAERDYSDKQGCWALCTAIEKFWNRIGFRNVVCRPVAIGNGMFAVKSNLVNGLPPQ